MPSRNRSDGVPARVRNAGATRAALLQAATVEFAERGYAGARVDEIAELAGVNKRMIYAYFGDKQGLFREVLRSRLLTPRAADERSPDARSALAAQVRWYFRLLAEEPVSARLLAWAMLERTGTAERASLLSSATPGLDLLRHIVRIGIRAGTIRSDVEPEVLLTTIASVSLGYFVQREAMLVALARVGGGRIDDEAFVEGICRVLLDGICASAGEARAEFGARTVREG